LVSSFDIDRDTMRQSAMPVIIRPRRNATRLPGLGPANALGVPMWVHETVRQLWRFAEQRGL